MQSIRFIATLLAFLLPQASFAAVLGPKVVLPLEWVWNRSNYGGTYYKATAFVNAATASSGTDFLVVWTQSARFGVVGPNGEAPWQTTPGVFALRMDSAGAILDAAPLLLSADWSGPTLVGAGSWVAYAEASDSYLAAFGCPAGLCAARVSSSGALLDAAPIALPSGGTAAVTSDGVRHFVLSGSQVFVVAADGTWTAFPIAFTPGAVASDGLNLLNVAGPDITLAGPDGVTLATASLPAGINGRSVTFDGSGYTILGYGPGPDGESLEGEYLTRVDTGGAVIGTTSRLRTGYADNFFDVSFDGLNAVAVWCPTPPAYDGGPVTIAVLQPGAPVADAQFLTTGKVLNRLSSTSNAVGTSAIVVDGFAYGESFNSFHPAVQFVTSWAPVAVSKSGAGSGTVISAPAGIDCGPTCTAGFAVPATVTLTATADAGSTFEGWSGDCAGTDPVCIVSFDAASSVVATFAATPPPTLTVPDTIHAIATTAHGTPIEFAVSARDGNGGALTAVCTPASGSIFPPGITSVACTATDAANRSASASFDVMVTFGWSGVLRPISADGSSIFKLGRSIPVKFQLAGASAGIPDLIATLTIAKISDEIQGSADESLWTIASDDGNFFRFDPASGNYIFNLSTRGLSSGTWALRFDFGDGVNRAVSFSLRQ